MAATMRPFVILTNLMTFIWFVFLQYYRFKNTGRACSGDNLDANKLPSNYDTVYLSVEGLWLKIFIIAQYILFFVCKIAQIVVTNKLSAAYEEQRAKVSGAI